MNRLDQHTAHSYGSRFARRLLSAFVVPAFAAFALISASGCHGEENPDEQLERYAAAYNAQARQIMPLSQVLGSFNAAYEPDGRVFSITVDLDSSFIRTEKIDEAHVRERLVHSFGDELISPETSLPAVLDRAGATLRFLCTSSASDTVCRITMTPAELRMH